MIVSVKENGPPYNPPSHQYPGLQGKLGPAGTQAHVASEAKVTAEFQKHGAQALPSLRAECWQIRKPQSVKPAAFKTQAASRPRHP